MLGALDLMTSGGGGGGGQVYMFHAVEIWVLGQSP